MKRIIVILLLALFLNSCEQTIIERKETSADEQPANETLINETNQTEVVPETTASIVFTPRDDNLTVYFLDIDGSATLIQYEGKSVLINAGYETDSQKVLKSIRDLGIEKLDYIFATNTQPKNIGGMPYIILRTDPSIVVENGVPSNFKAYKEYKNLFNQTTIIKQDTVFYLDDFSIATYVAYDDGGGFALNLDDNSLVTRIIFGNIDIILMSDCGLECEERIGNSDVSADIMEISGSCDSSSLKFLQDVNPDFAVVSSKNSEFCPNIVNRFKQLNIPLYQTGVDGNIYTTSDGYDISMGFGSS